MNEENRTGRRHPGPPRRVQRSLMLGAMALVVPLMITGCTGGGHTVSSSTAGPSSVTSGPAGTEESPGSAQAGAVLSTAIGTESTVVTLPPPDGPIGPARAIGTGALDATLAHILPGAYGLDSLGATVVGTTIDLSLAGSCVLARDIIKSGQWQVTPVVQPHDDTDVSVDVLTQGSRTALAYLKGSQGLCTGRIAVEQSEELHLSGSITATGPAQAVTVSCMPLLAEDGTDPAHSVIVSYHTGDAALLAMLTVPDAVGQHPVDEDDAVGLVALDPDRPALQQAATVSAAFFDPTQITSEAFLPGVDEDHVWFGSEHATVTVTSTDPLAGTVDAPEVTRVSDESTAAFSAGFHC